jgi:hypothetical protein
MWRLKHKNKQTTTWGRHTMPYHVASLQNILFLKNWDKMCLY